MIVDMRPRHWWWWWSALVAPVVVVVVVAFGQHHHGVAFASFFNCHCCVARAQRLGLAIKHLAASMMPGKPAESAHHYLLKAATLYELVGKEKQQAAKQVIDMQAFAINCMQHRLIYFCSLNAIYDKPSIVVGG